MLLPALFATDLRAATFCPRRVYRYELWRRWADGSRYVNFICTNPSTADEICPITLGPRDGTREISALR